MKLPLCVCVGLRNDDKTMMMMMISILSPIVDNSPALIHQSWCIADYGDDDDFKSFITVSYTHLDVYKRQVVTPPAKQVSSRGIRV